MTGVSQGAAITADGILAYIKRTHSGSINMIGNRIKITTPPSYNETKYYRGMFLTNSYYTTIENNNIILGSENVSATCKGILVGNVTGALITGNQISGVSTGPTIGIHLLDTCSNNYGTENMTTNLTTSVQDDGPNNTITAQAY